MIHFNVLNKASSYQVGDEKEKGGGKRQRKVMFNLEHRRHQTASHLISLLATSTQAHPFKNLSVGQTYSFWLGFHY